MDRFATRQDTVCWHFNSYLPDRFSAGLNAFASTNWSAFVNWCHPPPRLLSRVSSYLLQVVLPCRVVVYTPYWPASPWFSTLASAALWVIRVPRLFPALTTPTPFDYVLFAFGVFAVRQLPPGWAYIKAPSPSAKRPPTNLLTPPSKRQRSNCTSAA